MSRAPLALIAILLAGVAAAAPAAKPKDQRLALKAAACSQESPSLLIKLPADRQGSESGAEQPQAPTRLDRSDPAACEQQVASLPDSAQLAFSPSGAAGSPNGPVPEEEASKAFAGQTATVGELATRLSDLAQNRGIDLDVLSGRQVFDNASASAAAAARKEMAGALKKELSAPVASAEIPKDYPRPATQQRINDTTSPPAVPQEEDSGAEPGTTLSDIPLVGGFVNRHLPNWSDTPLNPFNRASSPPEGLQGPVNPNGTAAPPGLKTQGDKTDGAPIWAPFQAKLKACRPDCQAQQYGIWRPGDPTSCHHTGAAIDLHSIKCADGKLYKAIESGKDSGPFADLVTCMRSDKGGGHLFAIWHQCFKNCGRDVTSNHMDHTHLSIGCGGGRK